MAVIETMRNVAGVVDADTTEFNLACTPVVGLMHQWQKDGKLEQRVEGGDLGGTMRLGAYPCELKEGSKVRAIYGVNEISERHRHRYEVNNEYRQDFIDHGMLVDGTSPDGRLVEAVEIKDHPFFIGVQFHPEFKSRPNRAHPIFREFVRASLKHRDEVEKQ